MSFWRILWRGLCHYRRMYSGVFLATVIAAAVLCGALFVGDSVRASLRRQVLLRLGRVGYALSLHERFATDRLAESLSKGLSAPVSAVLQVRASMNVPNDSAYSGQVNLYGVDDSFAALYGIEKFSFAPDSVMVNRVLADLLGVKSGSEIVLRMADPKKLPGDMGARETASVISRRVKVQVVVSDESFGLFNLKNEQVAEPTAFMPIRQLQNLLGVSGKANLFLVAYQNKEGQAVSQDDVDAILRRSVKLADYSLEVKPLQNKELYSLTSDNVFLSQYIAETTKKMFADTQQVLTYFVNSISYGKRVTPYSFISGASGETVPAPSPGKIVLTDWLADDLGVSAAGEAITIRYYISAEDGTLREEQSVFTVENIIPVSSLDSDEFAVLFPGFSNAASCSDWDPDLPVDLKKIRDKDEAYWTAYKALPKAFVNINDAQRMWANRYGVLTSLHIPSLDFSLPQVERKLLSQLNPARTGLIFRPVRREGLTASLQGVDFGGLFIGLSFFIILSALILSAAVYVFLVESRSGDVGTLYALGFTRRLVWKMFFFEGGLVAAIGVVVGGILGGLYCKLVVWLLQTVWQGAVGQTLLWSEIRLFAFLEGVLISFVLSLGVIGFCLWRLGRYSPNTLQRRGMSNFSINSNSWLYVVASLITFAGGVAIYVSTGNDAGNVGAFFGAGSLLLIGGVLGFYSIVKMVSVNHVIAGLWGMVCKQAGRRAGRSTAAIVAFACGVFCVVAVGSNRQSPGADAGNVRSGSGGYALYVQSALALPRNIDKPDVEDKLGFSEKFVKGARIVPMRLLGGSDASCLNLNRSGNPPLLGVDPGVFEKRDAFSFVSFAEQADKEKGWGVLNESLENDTIAAVADAAVIKWGLGLSVGDELLYTAEDGSTFKVKLVAGIANSVFQGKILIRESDLIKYYPSVGGANVLLIDTLDVKQTADELRQRLQDYGVSVQTTASRLDMFARVENTYLSVFLILGGLGLAIGTAGQGVLLLLSALERRNELAMLRAVGFSKKRIFRMLAYENTLILFSGLLIGLVASLPVAVPAILRSADSIPYALIGVCLGGIVLCSVVSTVLAAKAALSGSLLDSLRTE